MIFIDSPLLLQSDPPVLFPGVPSLPPHVVFQGAFWPAVRGGGEGPIPQEKIPFIKRDFSEERSHYFKLVFPLCRCLQLNFQSSEYLLSSGRWNLECYRCK